LVAFGALSAGDGVFGAVTFGVVPVGGVAVGAGLSDVVVVDAVPAGGVAFGAFGVCAPWEKAGAATESNNSGTATKSSLRIESSFASRIMDHGAWLYR